MAESPYKHVQCQAIVLAINETQLQGDPISEQLRADLLSALERSGARNVVLDFQKINFVSSVAFRPLLSLHRRLKEQGGRLILCGMSERVAEVFQVTRLVSTTGASAAPFELQKDTPTAIASLYQKTASDSPR